MCIRDSLSPYFERDRPVRNFIVSFIFIIEQASSWQPRSRPAPAMSYSLPIRSVPGVPPSLPPRAPSVAVRDARRALWHPFADSTWRMFDLPSWLAENPPCPQIQAPLKYSFSHLNETYILGQLHACQQPKPIQSVSPCFPRASMTTRRLRRRENGHPRPSNPCLLYTSPSPRDRTRSRMPSSA